jgi:hypothetical protein
MQGFMSAIHGLKSDKLDLILHSPGGSMEAAEQIVQYLRAKYKHIRAFVPQNAMSAATMVACAADVIVMGKHSSLGPIDPQVEFPTPSGKFVAPAQAILDEFEQAKREIATNPSTVPIWLTKVQAYPPGFLQMCRNTLDLARDKVATWLDNYMFGSQEKDRPGKRIAEWLGDANRHKTHGRPIDLKQARNIGLQVEELEADQELQERVLSAFHATMVTFKDTQCVKLVENHQGRGVYTQVQMKAIPVSQ